MGRSHLKVYLDFEDRAEALSDAEKGRLLLAMVRYARTGEAPALGGNERFVFPAFKAEIDRDIANYDQKVANGSKGGRPATKPNETENNLTKPKITENNLTKPKREEEDKEEEEEDKDKDKENNSSSCAAASTAPDEIDVFLRLPTVDGREYPVTFAEIDKAKSFYPAVDVEQEIRNMAGWLDGHSANRKTWGGMKKFINGWLSRAQNNAHVVQPKPRQVVNAFAEYAERLAREGVQ